MPSGVAHGHGEGKADMRVCGTPQPPVPGKRWQVIAGLSGTLTKRHQPGRKLMLFHARSIA